MLMFTKGNLLLVVVLSLLSCFGLCVPENDCSNGTLFYLELKNGRIGSQTTWTLRNLDTGTRVDRGGPHSAYYLVEREYCLEQGCYEFEIGSNNGGPGGCRPDYYFIDLDGENYHYSDGVFGYDEKISFCAGGCDDFKFSLDLGMDYYIDQTSWKLRKVGTGSQLGYPEIRSGDGYRISYYDYYQTSSNIYVEQCIDPGCYVFQIFDEDGDGIYYPGSPDTVGYAINVDEEEVYFGNGDYGFGESTSFCVGSSGCLDSTLMIVDYESPIGCADVANDLSLCNLSGVQSHCPSACDACADYACDDSTSLVEYNGVECSCAILESSDEIDIDNACSRKDIFSTCRKTCSNNCVYP